MISYALIANGQHNPYLATPLPEHMLYPISQNCSEGIDLDYGALILGEHFIIDEAVFDDIMSSRKEYFKPMKHSFRELKSCGLLETLDYSAFFQDNSAKIQMMTNQLLEQPEKWLKLEQEQWRTLEDELQEFQKTYGSTSMYHHNITNIGIESWLSRTDQLFNNALRNDLYLLFRGKKEITEIDIENVRGSLQFIVAQIVMSDLISHSVKSPILDWEDSKGLYDRLYKLRWESCSSEMELYNETSRIFNVVIPDLKPNNIDQVIRFISNNKNVLSLRETILSAIDKGEKIDEQWMQRYIHEILKSDLAIHNKSSKFNFLGTILGLLPLPWGVNAAVTGATVVADKALFRTDRKYEWYYALQKIITTTKNDA